VKRPAAGPPAATSVTAAALLAGYVWVVTRRLWWIIAATGAALGFSPARLVRLGRLGRLGGGRTKPRGRFDRSEQNTRHAPARALSRTGTQASVPVQPADLDLGEPGRNTERRLDEALEETFPGSDPISVHIE
jgi:hypothetical protein